MAADGDLICVVALGQRLAGFSKAVPVPTLPATLAIDGLINLTVEELYFRRYLLPRLPVTGSRATRCHRPCS